MPPLAILAMPLGSDIQTFSPRLAASQATVKPKTPAPRTIRSTIAI